MSPIRLAMHFVAQVNVIPLLFFCALTLHRIMQQINNSKESNRNKPPTISVGIWARAIPFFSGRERRKGGMSISD
jgi:hypothetical protein